MDFGVVDKEAKGYWAYINSVSIPGRGQTKKKKKNKGDIARLREK